MLYLFISLVVLVVVVFYLMLAIYRALKQLRHASLSIYHTIIIRTQLASCVCFYSLETSLFFFNACLSNWWTRDRVLHPSPIWICHSLVAVLLVCSVVVPVAVYSHTCIMCAMLYTVYYTVDCVINTKTASVLMCITIHKIINVLRSIIPASLGNGSWNQLSVNVE